MDPSDLPTPATIHGRYQVIRLLRDGDLGPTYQVRDAQVDGEHLSLKLFQGEMAENGPLREALLRRATEGQNVVGEHVHRLRTNGVDESNRPYLLRDFVEGESLRERLLREDVLQPRQAVEIAHQVLEALASAHEKGVLHGNVHPDTVLLKRAVPKTQDNPFGIDVRLSGFGMPRPDERETPGSVDGLYVAPDWTEEENVDSRADLFSVSMLLCEMLLGSQEFRAGGAQRLREAILGGDESRIVAPLRSIETSLRRPLIIALSRKREGRMAGTDEFQQVLRRSDVFARERTRAPISLVVAALIVAGVGFLLHWQSKRELGELQQTKAAERSEAEDRSPQRQQLDRVADERDAALIRVRELEAQLTAAERAGPAPAGRSDPADPPSEASEWAPMLASPSQVEPGDALALASTAGDEVDPRLRELLEAYRDELFNRVAKGGALDRNALARESTLLEWTRLLDENPRLGRWPASRDVRFTGFAHRFLIEGDPGELPWDEVFDPSAVGRSDWRLETYLRARFVQRWPWLLRGEFEARVFARRAGDQLTYVKLEFARPPDSELAVFKTTSLDGAGNVIARREQRVLRQGARYEWDGQVFDLRAASASARLLELDAELADLKVPRQAGIRPEEFQAWRAKVQALSEHDRLCLVVSNAGREVWLCPELGMVRIREGQAVQELVATAPRN